MEAETHLEVNSTLSDKIPSAESTDSELSDEAMDADPQLKFGGLSGTQPSSMLPSADPSAQLDYNKDLPYLDLEDADFLEDVKATQWARHTDELLTDILTLDVGYPRSLKELLAGVQIPRPEEPEVGTSPPPLWTVEAAMKDFKSRVRPKTWKMARILERLHRISGSAYASLIEELKTHFAPEMVDLWLDLEKHVAALQTERGPVGKTAVAPVVDNVPFDASIFVDLPRLREALESKPWRLIIPALSYMFCQRKESEAMEAVFQVAGKQTCEDLLEHLRVARLQEAEFEADAANYWSEARMQFPDGPVEIPEPEIPVEENLEAAEPEEQEEPVPTKARKPTNLCSKSCKFGAGQGPATTFQHKGRRSQKCLFCAAENIQTAHACGKLGVITHALHKLLASRTETFDLAVEAIAQALDRSTAEKYKQKALLRARRKQPEVPQDWTTALANRKLIAQVPAAMQQQHETAKLAGLRRLCKKFPHLYGPDAVENEDWMTTRAKQFHRWCKFKSWRLCAKCSVVVKEDFRASHAKGKDRAKVSLPNCKYCGSENKQKRQGYAVRAASDVPDELRDLPQNVLEALALIEVDTGPKFVVPNGYRVHTSVTRLRWKPRCLKDNIAALPRADRKLAKVAAKKLRRSPESSYRKFYDMHNTFLVNRQHGIDKGQVDEHAPCPKLPANFMETVGIECAIWPSLYWETEMCETYVRSQDKRRLAKSKKPAPDEDSSAESNSDDEVGAKDEVGGSEGQHQSSKASFLAKLQGPIIGYGDVWELLQFQYDLWLATTIGGARNSAGISTRAALSGKSLSPEYWRKFHMALVDLQEQIGWPTFFITTSIYEWSAPYHVWVEDEMRKLCRERLGLPVAESLHIAHILTQAVKGLLTGANDGQDIQGEHTFAATEDKKKPTVLNYAALLSYS